MRQGGHRYFASRGIMPEVSHHIFDCELEGAVGGIGGEEATVVVQVYEKV